MARPHLLIRALVLILAVVAGWIGLLQPTVAGASLPAMPSASFAYDNYLRPAGSIDTATERGPPNATYDYTSYNADDGLGSPGASARSDDARTRAIYDYDDLARFVQGARSCHAAEGPSRGGAACVGTAARNGDRLMCRTGA